MGGNLIFLDRISHFTYSQVYCGNNFLLKSNYSVCHGVFIYADNGFSITGRGNLNSSGGKKRQIEYSDFKNKEFLFDTVKRCQDGDVTAMELIYNAYRSSLFNLAYRFTREFSQAEDLLQDIFLKIYANIKKLKSPEAFNSWLYRIAANTCISFARKKGKTKEIALEEIGDIGAPENDGNQIRLQLEKAMHILPPRQKIVFQLHDIQGFTNIEIAKIMRCSEGTAKSQLFKARMKMRNLLRST